MPQMSPTYSLYTALSPIYKASKNQRPQAAAVTIYMRTLFLAPVFKQGPKLKVLNESNQAE